MNNMGIRKSINMTTVQRRRFLRMTAGTAALPATSSSTFAALCGDSAFNDPCDLPAPQKAPFDTVVVLMVENRSFDHLLGWLPGADGRQHGLSYEDKNGRPQRTWPLAPDFQGCQYLDPEHTWEAIRIQYAEGRCDGWLKTPSARIGDHFPLGYYREGELPILHALAKGYTTFDRYFSSMMGPTWENRLYQLSATTQLMDNCDFPRDGEARPVKIATTIFDRVRKAGLTAGYYYHSSPITKLFASLKYDDISHPIDRFWEDAAKGTLPNVVFVDPDYSDIAEDMGVSNDYHPWGHLLNSEGFLARVHDTLKRGPQWERMVFVLNFDEHGGFFDHVVPPRCEDDTEIQGPDLKRLGFRVPAIAMGPFAPQRIEKRGPFEHCSILRMIEWRWGLEPLRLRDRQARNLAEALDFSRRREAITLPEFAAPPPQSCSVGGGWVELRVARDGTINIPVETYPSQSATYSVRVLNQGGREFAAAPTRRHVGSTSLTLQVRLTEAQVAAVLSAGNRVEVLLETLANPQNAPACRSTSPALLRVAPQ
jgi:phospholipase C